MSKRQRRSRAKQRRHEERHPRRAQVAAGAGLALGATLGITGTAHAADFTVTNLNDSGGGSLRQAVNDADNNSGADRILFQSGLSGTINLTTGQLDIDDPVEIQGPGPGTLTVQNTGASRIAYVHPGDGQSVTISGLTLIGASGNDVQSGGVFWTGGIGSNSNLTISNSVLTGSEAVSNGGGVYVYRGSLQLENTTISGNHATDGDGGAIDVYVGSVQIESSTLSGNTAGNAGGGIYFYDTNAPSEIRNSTLSGNSVTDVGGDFDDGGAVYITINASQSPILIENSTLSGNTVPGSSGDHGGAVYDFSYPTSALTIDSSTIAGNTSGDDGGGVYQYYGTTIRNTIIADNTADDLAGPTSPPPGVPASVSFSLIETLGSTTPINATGPNILGQDPQLGPLASNGGPTQTQALSAGSPATDKGNTSLGRDQRGSLRPFDLESTANAAGGNGADIGAFELLVTPTCKGKPATIFPTTPATHKLNGTNKADVIVGTNGKDKINAKGGNDTVCALGGKDTVKGGKGKDTLLGGKGKDKLIGGPGKDKLKGGPGKDVQKQ
jgi:hypothetical protein